MKFCQVQMLRAMGFGFKSTLIRIPNELGRVLASVRLGVILHRAGVLIPTLNGGCEARGRTGACSQHAVARALATLTRYMRKPKGMPQVAKLSAEHGKRGTT